MNKRFLGRDAILKQKDLEIIELFVPEWDGYILVRGMTARERDQWETSIVKQKGNNTQLDMRNARARLVAMCVVDQKGNRVFGDSDVAALGNMSAKAIDRIFSVAQDLSGVSNEDVEELTKNFEQTSSEDLSID